MRNRVRQAGAAVPVRIMFNDIGLGWRTILEPPDFSVPDPQQRFPDARDPLDNDRRIQPGFCVVEAPIMFHNNSDTTVTVSIRVLAENGEVIEQATVSLVARDTYLHPAPGQRLLKTSHTSEHGDRLQVSASEANVIHLTSIASEGAAEQHEPEFN